MDREGQQPPPPSRTDLWFQFISNLNDRELQRSQSSGFNAWVIIGAIALIIYKGFPLIPKLLLIPNFIARTSFFLFTLAYFLLHTCRFWNLIIGRFSIQERARWLPNWLSRFANFVQVSKLVFDAMLLLLGTYAFWSFRHLSTIFTLGAILILSSFIDLVISAFGRRLVSFVVRMGFPREISPRTPNLVISATSSFVALLNCSLAFIAGSAIILFCRALQRAGEDWISPLSAATNIAVCLCLFGLLLIKQIRAATTGQFLQSLESEIVVNELEAEEIRTIYESRIAGESAGAWLTALKSRFGSELNNADDLISDVASEASGLVNMLCVDHYSGKDEARAAQILRTIELPLERLSGELRALEIQVPQLMARPMVKGDATFGMRTVLETWGELNSSFIELARKAEPMIRNLERVLDDHESRAGKIVREAIRHSHKQMTAATAVRIQGD